ncbi:unnamed protein product [Paramecium sonneborni]|nr:unnamed protein product [Paramecium sonneborni]
MSLKSKLKIKNKMLKQKDLEQINSEEFLYNCEKLISILIENNQLRHALLLYLLFECDLEIYEIQYLKFDAIKQRKFNLNYEKQGSKISKKVEVSEQIQILCLAIMKKYDLQEQSQILYLNSNRDVQTMLECLKKTYLSKIEQENNQNFIVFLKKFKLSDIKKYDIKSNQFYELISLYLRFEIEINKYGFINQNTIQSQLQPPALKKSKSQLDLIRIQNIQKLEQSTALVLMIEDEQILVKQNLNENNTQIVRQENKFLDRPETEIKDIEIFTENII